MKLAINITLFICVLEKSKFKQETEFGNNHQRADVSVVNFNVMNCSSNTDVIIPTFSATVNSSKVRVMYDPAAQATFISEQAYRRLNPRIVNKNLKIRVSGFNSSKVLITKLVQIKLLLNTGEKTFNAVVVPEIKSKVNANIPKVVQSFRTAAIPMADLNLTKGNGGIDILLGVDNIHIIPVQSCNFGINESLSLVYYTCQGIMLSGSLSTLNRNLAHLNLVQNFITKFNVAFEVNFK